MAEQKKEDPGLTMENILRMFAEMQQKNQEALLAAVQELKRPSEMETLRYERDKKVWDKEHQMELEKARRSSEAARQIEEAKAMKMRTCSHSAYHPVTGIAKHMWRAQVHAPKGERPYFIPTCTRCWSQLPKIMASPEMVANGVNLDDYAGLDVNILTNWAKESVKQAVA